MDEREEMLRLVGPPVISISAFGINGLSLLSFGESTVVLQLRSEDVESGPSEVETGSPTFAVEVVWETGFLNVNLRLGADVDRAASISSVNLLIAYGADKSISIAWSRGKDITHRRVRAPIVCW